METAKSDYNKQKLKGKLPCSSNQSSKFIEKEGLSGFSLSFSNLPSSLCDFIPKDQESLSHEIDFDIAKHLKKLEKKDPLTKQKSLTDLLEMFSHKDGQSVISTLKFWPKLYNRLSLDEDKKVRELTQQLMRKYSNICGKEISSFIKQLLPTWIISQSDLHIAAANIAKQSFIETFPDKIKQEKAYLLCWRSIYEIICTNLSRAPLDIGEHVDYTVKEETYIKDIVINIRTIITLIPYLKNNEDASKDLTTLLKSKNFWSHFKLNVILIQSIYIQLGTELLDYFSELVTSSAFIASNICECVRMINNYHPHLISRIWTSIVKCCEHLDSLVWKFVSFKSAFLPKFVELFECAADGNISQIYSRMLPFFCHLPIAIDSAEANIVFEQIFVAMVAGCECSRVINNELESNCVTRMVFECSVYVIIVAGNNGNTSLGDTVLQLIFGLAEKHFTDIRFKKATKAMSDFASCVVSPLIKKQTIPIAIFIDTILGWIEKHHTVALFCENLTSLLLELDQLSGDQLQSFRTSLLERVGSSLRQKIVDRNQQCLIPYFHSCLSPHESQLSVASVLEQCPFLMREYNASITSIVSRGLARIFCSCEHYTLRFDEFLASLSTDQSVTFFTQFYTEFLGNIDDRDIARALGRVSLSNWQRTIIRTVEQMFLVCDNSSATLQLATMLDLCGQIDIHGMEHIAVLLACASDTIDANIAQPISTDSADRLMGMMEACISSQLSSCSVVPAAFVKNLLKLILCSSPEGGRNGHNDISAIVAYLHNCPTELSVQLSEELINESISQSAIGSCDVAFASCVIGSIVSTSDRLIEHIESVLLADLALIETALSRQWRYSPVMVHSKLDLVVAAVNKIIVLHSSQNYLSDRLSGTINCVSVLLDSVITLAFSSCHNSNRLLNQCETVHKLVQSLDLGQYCDRLLVWQHDPVFGSCPTLVLLALQRAIPPNYALWSGNVRAAIDRAIIGWADTEYSSMTDVLLSCAVKARYVVQESILASLVSHLSDGPSIGNINRALSVMAALCTADPSYFPLCFDIVTSVKSVFEGCLDRLSAASTIESDGSDNFSMTALLQLIAVGVESATTNSSQWEFILCLIDTLIRSEPFSNCGNYRTTPIVDDRDHLINAYWLLKIVSSAAVTLASVKIGSIIDEWDNFFSQPIFTAVLDQFSLIAGHGSLGKLVCSDLFIFYTEALSDAVSLCPVAVLLGHAWPGLVHINDPVDFPPDFLVAFNFLLDSLSSASLSVQLAAYNCLQNLTEMLSDLLLEQVNASERSDSLDISFSINLPCRLVDYIVAIDNFDQLNLDIIDNQIVLVRCFLSWNIVLQLFSTAPPKVRAEISAFLSQNDRCFDRFLNFCFTFMPKNPIVNKKHLSFIEDSIASSSNSCNLIAEEPQIFSQCVEKRSKFIIYHLSAYIFRRSMQVLPNLCRGWWHSLDTNSQQIVDSYVRQFLTRELFKIEFKLLKEIADKQFDEKLEIKAIPLIGEVTVKYNVSCDQSLEQLIRLPSNYPIGNISAEYKKEMTVKIPHWKSWIGQMTMTLENQNGSIFDGIKLWKRNLDNYFNGIEDCMICYSIIHPSKYTLPTMPCYQCKKKFHKQCMFKWFHSSTNPTCPNCRNVFYDGSQKSSK